jgi:hypothetical protein
MPAIRMNALKSLAMNCGPLPELIRGHASARRSICKILVNKNACLKSVSPLSDAIVHSRTYRQTSAPLLRTNCKKKRRSRQWSPW